MNKTVFLGVCVFVVESFEFITSLPFILRSAFKEQDNSKILFPAPFEKQGRYQNGARLPHLLVEKGLYLGMY